jgi:hypothetical protein
MPDKTATARRLFRVGYTEVSTLWEGETKLLQRIRSRRWIGDAALFKRNRIITLKGKLPAKDALDFEEKLGGILKNELEFISKNEYAAWGISFQGVKGVKVKGLKGSTLVQAEVTELKELIPDYLHPKTYQMADAKWYHTLRTQYGQNLTDKSWYSIPENRLKVKTSLSAQIVNYTEAQRQVLLNEAKRDGRLFLQTLPNPPFILIFGDRQAEWMKDFLVDLPAIGSIFLGQ